MGRGESVKDHKLTAHIRYYPWLISTDRGSRRHLAGEGVTGDITSSSPLWALGAKVSRGKYEGGRERFALDVPAVTSDGWIGWRGLLRWREGFVCELLVCEACTGTGVLRRLLLGLETGLLGCWRSPLPQQQSQQHGIQQ